MLKLMPAFPSTTLAVAAALFASCSSSLGQELLPTIEEVTAHERLPADGVFDLRGFALLDSVEEVETLKADFPESDYVWTLRTETRGLSDGRGNKVLFSYGPTTYVIKKKQGFEEYHIHFTSSLLGNRVLSVDLNQTFRDQEVALDSLLAAFEEKYGKPTYVNNSKGYTELSYVYEGSQKLEIDFEDFSRNRFRSGTFADRVSDCDAARSAVAAIGSIRSYRFDQDRERKQPACSGGMRVSLNHGARPDLIRQMTVHIAEADLSFRNDTTQDQFLLDALLGDKQGKEGAAAPKL